jgi:hypothetical protein
MVIGENHEEDNARFQITPARKLVTPEMLGQEFTLSLSGARSGCPLAWRRRSSVRCGALYAAPNAD